MFAAAAQQLTHRRHTQAAQTPTQSVTDAEPQSSAREQHTAGSARSPPGVAEAKAGGCATQPQNGGDGQVRVCVGCAASCDVLSSNP